MGLFDRLFGRKPKPCVVSVWHVNVEGQGVPPYYVARCDCDWVGTCYDDSADPAFAEARTHATEVRPEVEEIE